MNAFTAIPTHVRYRKKELTAACSRWTQINLYLSKLENAIYQSQNSDRTHSIPEAALEMEHQQQKIYRTISRY